MKIKDIISEAPSGYQQGKAAMTKLLSPSKWLDNTKFKQDYDRGHDTMTKVIATAMPSDYTTESPIENTTNTISFQEHLVSPATKPLCFNNSKFSTGKSKIIAFQASTT
jgi:hypothetical protein